MHFALTVIPAQLQAELVAHTLEPSDGRKSAGVAEYRLLQGVCSPCHLLKVQRLGDGD